MKKIMMLVVLLGLSGGAYAAEFGELAVGAGVLKTSGEEQNELFRPDVAGYAANARPVEWVSIPAGKFLMGAEISAPGSNNTRPVRGVEIKTFKMAKAVVTVEQYAKCVNEGKCTEPAITYYSFNCNWYTPDRRAYPMNCLNGAQMKDFAGFAGARLPTEAEWEYAARSGGKNNKYPWGNEPVTHDRAVYDGPENGIGGGTNGTMPVCSKPAGNTEQGLCDMAGNVWQVTQDIYKDSYAGAPVDGGAVTGAADGDNVIRGNSFYSSDEEYLRADFRSYIYMRQGSYYVGFRLVK
ncbi:MAG: formylglycine-generating enzyme family protein [Elusimicrobiales bacterium]|nr:formylglycine-generating enzyme family protein [Elusimicrobiales bacterium]